jgi:hypothetical protein
VRNGYMKAIVLLTLLLVFSLALGPKVLASTVKQISQPIEVNVTDNPPTAPSDLKANPRGCYEIDLTWEAVAGAKGYNIYRSNSDSQTPFVKVQELEVETTSDQSESSVSYADKDLESAKTFWYKVSVVNDSGESPLSDTVRAATKPPVKTLKASSAQVKMAIGDQKQIALWATYTDGSTEEVGALAVWKSSKPLVATVSNEIIEGITKGATIVTASYGGRSASISVTVTPLIDRLECQPKDIVLLTDQTKTLKFTLFYMDGSSEDLTKQVKLISYDPKIAEINGTGVKGKTHGVTVIEADYNNLGWQFDVQVSALVKSLTANPTQLTLNILGSCQLVPSLYYNYTDGTTEPVLYNVHWRSANSTIITLRDEFVYAEGVGSTFLIGTVDGKYTIRINVKVEPYLHSLAVEHSQTSVLLGKTQTFPQVLGVYIYDKEGRIITKDLSRAVTWKSANPDIAVITSTGIKGIALGETLVTAQTNDEYRVDIYVKVTAPPTSLTAGQTWFIFPEATSGCLRIYANYGDDSQEDVSFYSKWKSFNSKVVELAPDGGFITRSVGSTTLTATYGGKSINLRLKVTPDIDSLQVQPEKIVVLQGRTKAAKFSLVYINGKTEDVSSYVQLVSANPDIAVVTSSEIYGLAPGETTVTAICGYKNGQYWTVDIPVKVSVPVKSLTSNPQVLNLLLGGLDQRLTLHASYFTGTSEDVTAFATWKSSNPKVATVSLNGSVHALSRGSTTIIASFAGRSISIKVTVTN